VQGYTDPNGYLNLNVRTIDTLKAYALGYEKLVILRNEMPLNGIFFITPAIEQLDAVKLDLNRPLFILSAGKMHQLFFISANTASLTKITPNFADKLYRLQNIKVFFKDLKKKSKSAKKEGRRFAFKISA
jgi:hypothetical protein